MFYARDVTDRHTQVHGLLSRRRDGTPIAIRMDPDVAEIPRLLEVGLERHWRYFNLGITIGTVPPELEFAGAIVSDLPTDATVQQLLGRGVPVVRIGRLPHPDDHRVPAVLPDRVAAGPLAAEHLAERRFEHVAYIGRKPWADNEPVYKAFTARGEALGCRCHMLQEHISAFRRQADTEQEMITLRREAFWRWLDDTPGPLGLFTFGDAGAALYCQWVLQSGRRVPEDVAILGIGNFQFVCEGAAVELSSIKFDAARSVDTAVDVLEKLIAGQSLENHTIFVPPVGVVTRQSTDVLAASDAHVVKALQFMWDNVSRDLSVEQIARHVGVSRRTLEKAFRRDLRRGINEEFQRRRLEKARELLVQTDLRVGDVAEALSFSSAREFCRIFREAFGQPPGRYRKQARPAASKDA